MKNSITPTTRRALHLFIDHGPLSPTSFAELMWPDSPAWRAVYKCGPYGATRGRGIVKSAGSYLAKLARRTLIAPCNRRPATPRPTLYDITTAGLFALKEGDTP